MERIQKYQGEFPADLKQLQALPGIGRSTAGAILSLAFNQPAPILDGNVKRVLIRTHAIEGFSTDHFVSNRLWSLAEQFVPKNHATAYAQAMMDLGAIICTRKNPQCIKCPLKKHCQARAQGREQKLPRTKHKKPLPSQKTYILILKNNQQEILLEKRPPIGIWGGLWCFPECNNEEIIRQFCQQNYACHIITYRKLPPFRHTFTHFHLNIVPIHAEIEYLNDQILEAKTAVWHNAKKSLKLGIPKPVKHLLSTLQELN